MVSCPVKTRVTHLHASLHGGVAGVCGVAERDYQPSDLVAAGGAIRLAQHDDRLQHPHPAHQSGLQVFYEGPHRMPRRWYADRGGRRGYAEEKKEVPHQPYRPPSRREHGIGKVVKRCFLPVSGIRHLGPEHPLHRTEERRRRPVSGSPRPRSVVTKWSVYDALGTASVRSSLIINGSKIKSKTVVPNLKRSRGKAYATRVVDEQGVDGQ
jgi:hypothetical protein